MFRQLWDDEFTVISCASSWQDSRQPAWVADAFLDCLSGGVIEAKGAFATRHRCDWRASISLHPLRRMLPLRSDLVTTPSSLLCRP